jgi:molybdate transport repressor ModE-like protein
MRRVLQSKAACPSKAAYPMETQVSIRIYLETGSRIGPGRIALLEAISKTGSIRAAARSMDMSYRRAWLLVDELNKLLSEPAVTAAAGGARGGGADASWTKDCPTVPLHRNAYPSRHAKRISGFQEIDARLSAGRGEMESSRRLSVLMGYAQPATLSDLSRPALSVHDEMYLRRGARTRAALFALTRAGVGSEIGP